MQWKQSLYAFLLRRFLGPLLTNESKEQLSSCIELSFHEGRFLLHNISLEPTYLTSLIKNTTGNFWIEKSFVQKLTIHLSIQSLHNGPNDTSDKADESRSSTLSTMRRIMQLRRRGESMSLFASIEMDGLEIVVSPLGPQTNNGNNETIDPASRREENAETKKDTSSGSGYLSSLVDSALASLRLCVTINDANVRLLEKLSEFRKRRSWIDVTIASISYRDLTPAPSSKNQYENNQFDEKRQTGIKTEVLQKVIQISGLSIVSSLSSRNPIPKPILAFSDGTTTIHFHAYADEIKRTNVTLYNEIIISCNQRMTINLEDKKIQLLQSISQSFQESLMIIK